MPPTPRFDTLTKRVYRPSAPNMPPRGIYRTTPKVYPASDEAIRKLTRLKFKECVYDSHSVATQEALIDSAIRAPEDHISPLDPQGPPAMIESTNRRAGNVTRRSFIMQMMGLTETINQRLDSRAGHARMEPTYYEIAYAKEFAERE
jgi:hypothetical protein